MLGICCLTTMVMHSGIFYMHSFVDINQNFISLALFVEEILLVFIGF